MAEADFNRFLEGDLHNGIFKEIRYFSEYVSDIRSTKLKIESKDVSSIIQISMSFGILSDRFKYFLNRYGCKEKPIRSSEELKNSFGRLSISGQYSHEVVGVVLNSNIELINMMLYVYEMEKTFVDIIRADILVNGMLEYLLSGPKFKLVFDKITVEPKIKEDAIIPEFKVVRKRVGAAFKNQPPLSEVIDLKTAYVDVTLVSANYLRIGYTRYYEIGDMKFKTNVKSFSLPSMFINFFFHGYISKDNIDSFESSLVLYALDRAMFTDDCSIVMKYGPDAIASAPITRLVATKEQLVGKRYGLRLWNIYSIFTYCYNVNTTVARTMFEKDIVELLYKLGMIADVGVQNGHVNLTFKPHLKKSGYSQILNGTSQIRFDFVFMPDVNYEDYYLKNMISNVMIKVANKVEYSEDVPVFTLFPTSDIGPLLSDRLEIKSALMVIKVMLILLNN